jgi:hypothetical protein
MFYCDRECYFPHDHVSTVSSSVAATSENVGYGFILRPPKSGVYDHLYGSVDLLTLFVQIVGVSVVGCLLTVASKIGNQDRRRNKYE